MTATKTCHAAELVATVAGLSLGRALKGATTQVFITGNEIYLAQQTQDFAKSATLDDLAATSVFFEVPLALLRRERELNWEVLEIAPEDRPAVLERERNSSAIKLVAWIDAMETFGLLTLKNASEMRYQVLDLRDDTPGATAKDARRPAQPLQVLYAYHCGQCGHRGQLRHPEEHETISAECEACGAAVAAEWDGGVELNGGAQ